MYVMYFDIFFSHLNKKTQYDPPLKSPDGNSGGADPGECPLMIIMMPQICHASDV